MSWIRIFCFYRKNPVHSCLYRKNPTHTCLYPFESCLKQGEKIVLREGGTVMAAVLAILTVQLNYSSILSPRKPALQYIYLSFFILPIYAIGSEAGSPGVVGPPTLHIVHSPWHWTFTRIIIYAVV